MRTVRENFLFHVFLNELYLLGRWGGGRARLRWSPGDDDDDDDDDGDDDDDDDDGDENFKGDGEEEEQDRGDHLGQGAHLLHRERF